MSRRAAKGSQHAKVRTVRRRKEKADDYATPLYDAATEAAHRLTVAIYLLHAHEGRQLRDAEGYGVATAIDAIETAQDLLRQSAAAALREERQAEAQRKGGAE